MKASLILMWAVAALACVARADTIKLGTYQMTWSSASRQAPAPPIMISVELKPVPAGQRKSLGLVSAKSMYGTKWEYTVALDESKGTGKGYDVAYVSCKQKATLGDIVKVPLVEDKSLPCQFHSDFDARTPITLFLGTKASGLVEQHASVHVEVYSGNNRPQTCRVFVDGRWEGSIDTDSKPLRLRLYDSNMTGVFGDSRDERGDCDILALHMDNGENLISKPGFDWLQTLGDNLLYDGKLYCLTVDPAGRSITIGPFTGAKGMLAIKALDTSCNPVGFDASITGKRSAYIGQTATPIELPAGEYGIMTSLENGAQLRRYEGTSPFVVSPGRTTTLTVGGRLSLRLEPEGFISVKAGELVAFQVSLYAGQDEYTVTREEWNATLSFTGPNGEPIRTGLSADDLQTTLGHFSCVVPKNWKPGDYIIKAVLRADGKLLTASKKLIVTK